MDDSDQHYWVSNPNSTSRQKEVELLLPDIHLTLMTDRGVFSANQVDKGTRYLLMDQLKTTEMPKNLLDLGCGYGPIACALGRRNPEAKVWAIDTNLRAIDLCRINAEKNGIKNVFACLPEEIPEDIYFDANLVQSSYSNRERTSSRSSLRMAKSADLKGFWTFCGTTAPRGGFIS